ncbi:glutathione S-transferase domain-containing protein [Aspergillus pseudodeflectus]|uniref:Glutathione S-transferase domain-containing protein n=1 Tax=Aspergillus pseudodeflectus TaxID=176178 RepID=A0ABR4JCL3_9EURO
MVVRLFVLERGGLTLDVEPIDIRTRQNRRAAYREINPVPALQLDDDNRTIITEVPAICEYLDEVAVGGTSPFGSTPEQRAETCIRLRRMDLEICLPVIAWFKNDPDLVNFLKGDRIPTPEAGLNQMVMVNQPLDLLDDQLEGKTWLCGERFSAADVHFYGLLKMVTMQFAEWVLAPGRENFLAYWTRLEGREASKKALKPFPSKVVAGS